MNKQYTTVNDWQRRAEMSQARADDRRVQALEDRCERSWGRGFLLGFVMALGLSIAWFYPLLGA